MHAVVGVWTMAESQRAEQDKGLAEIIIPIVRAHPGFVCGYWMRDPETGKGHTTIVLHNEESARALKKVVEGNRQAQARAGITNDTLAVVEVQAHTTGSRDRASSLSTAYTSSR